VAAKSWLVDKSAYIRLGDCRDAETRAARLQRGLVRISTVTRLEIGYSFRSGAQFRGEFGDPPLSCLPVEYLTPAIEDRALEVQGRAIDFADMGGSRLTDASGSFD
jgi:predicted nucleic acid-binding protein